MCVYPIICRHAVKQNLGYWKNKTKQCFLCRSDSQSNRWSVKNQGGEYWSGVEDAGGTQKRANPENTSLKKDAATLAKPKREGACSRQWRAGGRTVWSETGVPRSGDLPIQGATCGHAACKATDPSLLEIRNAEDVGSDDGHRVRGVHKEPALA